MLVLNLPKLIFRIYIPSHERHYRKSGFLYKLQIGLYLT